MDSPDQYMNIVYKPCGFAERTRPRMTFPTQVGINPYARNSKQRLTAGQTRVRFSAAPRP